jgi:hypothetical protein
MKFCFQNDFASSSTGIGQYTISNAGIISEVWEITDLANITKNREQ